MAHTNSTSNYELSQFIGTDKPTFLGDYNGDMQKIDAAIKGAKDTADGASTTANAASALATSASETATQAASDAASANANATTALNTANNATTTAQNASTAAQSATATANTAATKADAAKTEAEAATAAVALKPSYSETFARMFNMISADVTNNLVPASSITISPSSTQISVAKNTDASLGKIYGMIGASITQTSAWSDVTVCTIPLGLVGVSAAYDIAGFSGYTVSGTTRTFANAKLRIKTDGNADVIIKDVGPNVTALYVQLPPCLLVLADFGD